METIWENRWLPDIYGGVAQLGEHLPCKQGVMSSNLTISTKAMSNAKADRQLCVCLHKSINDWRVL